MSDDWKKLLAGWNAKRPTKATKPGKQPAKKPVATPFELLFVWKKPTPKHIAAAKDFLAEVSKSEGLDVRDFTFTEHLVKKTRVLRVVPSQTVIDAGAFMLIATRVPAMFRLADAVVLVTIEMRAMWLGSVGTSFGQQPLFSSPPDTFTEMQLGFDIGSLYRPKTSDAAVDASLAKRPIQLPGGMLDAARWLTIKKLPMAARTKALLPLTVYGDSFKKTSEWLQQHVAIPEFAVRSR